MSADSPSESTCPPAYRTPYDPFRCVTICVLLALSILAPALANARGDTSREGEIAASMAMEASRLHAADAESADVLTRLIALYRVDLVDAISAMASAGYGPAERSSAVGQIYTADSATRSLADAGLRPSDAYLQLRAWETEVEAASLAVVEYYSEEAVLEVAEAMVERGERLEEVAFFLEYSGWSAQAIFTFLVERTDAQEEVLLGVLFRFLVMAERATGAEVDWIHDRLRGLFGRADAAGNWLMSHLGMTWERAGAVLSRAGYATEDTTIWLREIVGIALYRIVFFLKVELRTTSEEALGLLLRGGAEVRLVAIAVAEVWDLSAERLAEILYGADVNAVDIVEILLSRHGPSIADQLVDLLVTAQVGYGDAVAAVLETMNGLAQMQLKLMEATASK